MVGGVCVVRGVCGLIPDASGFGWRFGGEVCGGGGGWLGGGGAGLDDGDDCERDEDECEGGGADGGEDGPEDGSPVRSGWGVVVEGVGRGRVVLLGRVIVLGVCARAGCVRVSDGVCVV